MKNFLNNLHSLPESSRKKILVVCVSASMVLISFVWVYSMKNKLGIDPEKQNVSTEQIDDIKKNVLDNFNDIKLQGSVYQSMLDNTLEDLKSDTENASNIDINNGNNAAKEEVKNNTTKDQLITDELPEAENTQDNKN